MSPSQPTRTAEGATRNRIAQLLRRGGRTVDELADAVGLTRNAVRQHLSTLERDGIVVRRGRKRGAALGKPATVYEISAEAQSSFSRAYAPVLATLLAALPTHMPEAVLQHVLRDIGARLAGGFPVARGDLRERVQAGAAILEALGGTTEIDDDSASGAAGDRLVIRGCSCPLSQAVSACPELCQALERMLALVMGTDVTERCDRSGTPRCRFEISRAPAAA